MKTILIIDDQADNIISIKALLQNYISECNILTAMSGKEGIESARKNQPDTILLDIIMPEMDGFDTCERLKKDKQTQHIPIILITAIRTDTKSRVKGLEMGADAFLSKPIYPAELSAQVKVMLRIKEAEDKLREEKDDLDKLVEIKTKEVRYHATILENISDPIISVDMNHKIKGWNEGAEKLYGWKKEEVLGKAFKDILLPEYPHGSREEVLDTLYTTGYFKDEVIHYKKDGSRLIIIGSVSFIHDDHGNRTGIVSVNHDITEKKIAEKKLRDTQESLKYTFDISPGIICVADANTGFFISCNQAVKSILGFSITEFLSKPFVEFIHPDDKQKTVDEITKQLKGNSVAHFENRYQCKNKSFKWLAWQATKADKDGLVHAVATDITERKQEEKELLKNQYYLSKAQEIGNIGTWELDILKNQLLWTKENYKIFGVQFGTEMTYELFLNCIHPEDREYVDKKWSDALNNKPYDIEHRLLVKNKVKWVREKADITFDEKGNAVKAIGITHDITDRKIAEEKSKESEQLRMKLLDNLPVVTLILKYHSREIVACNKAALDMGAVVGKTCYESLTQCEHSCPFCLAPKLWETNESQITEAAYIGKHWEGRWIPFTDELYIHYIYDITERKQEEIKRRENANLLLKIAENYPNSYLSIIEKDFTIGFTSGQEFKKQNLDPKEFLGLTIDQVFGEHTDTVRGYYEKTFNGEECSFELFINNQHQLYKSIPLISDDGSIPRILSVVENITERKETEKQIQDQNTFLNNVIDSLTHPFLVINSDNYIVEMSNTASGFNSNKNKITCHQFSHNNVEPCNGTEHPCPLQIVKKTKKPVMVEHTHKDESGNEKYVEVYCYPLFDTAGNLHQVIEYSLDISERKRSEKIQKAIYNISNAVILSNDLEDLAHMIKNELHELLDTQNFFIALYDDKTKMINFPFFINDKDKIKPYKVGKSLTSNVITSGKTLFANISKKKQLVKEGKLIYKGSLSKIWLGVPLKIKEKVMGVISVQSYTDEYAYDESDVEILEFIADQISISLERKKAELDLKKALQKATESDRLKSAFLATMSHELRTPLNAIIGFSGIIDKDSTIDDIIRFNDTINSSGKHLLNIVEELFDITLIETGEMKIKKEPFDLYSLLYDVKEIIKLEQISNNKTHLKINLVVPPKEAGLIINSDPSKFKQILLNLLKNAIKFTVKGQVNFGFEIIKQKENFLLEFFIQDTGIGIAADNLELIFEAFRQVDESHTRIHGGTGIGLSISKRLVELIGGTIRVESTKGKGSTFYFTIPYEEKLNADYSVDSDIEIQTASEITKSHRIKNKNILIVEDDEASYEFLKTVLVKSGFTLLWAKNGEEAIHLCKEKSEIDLVLMDIDMPIMNGYEATKVIKKFRPKLPIIAQTAYAIIGDREKSIEAGCSDYISKPINRNMLLEKVKAQLSNTKTKN